MGNAMFFFSTRAPIPRLISSYGYVVKNSGITVLDASIKMAFKLFQANVKLASEKDRFQRPEERASHLHEVLAKEKDRLTMLIDSIADEIWFADAEGKFTVVNPAGRSEFELNTTCGIDVRDFADSLEVLRPDGSLRTIEEAPPLRALRGEVVQNQEEIIRTPSTGELRWRLVSATPEYNAAGQIIAFSEDFTERKEIEAKLRESQEILNLFLKHSPIHTFLKEVTERESRILYASESNVDIFGIPSSQMIGKTMADLFSPELSEKMTRDDWEVVSSNQGLTRNEEFSGRHYALTKFPIPLRGRKLIGSYAVDITDRKRAEESLRESEQS